MKKQIILTFTAVLSFGLMAFSFIHENETIEITKPTDLPKTQAITLTCNSPTFVNYVSTEFWMITYTEFFYNLGPRFDPIKKSELKNIKTVNYFLTKDDVKRIYVYQETALIIIKEDRQTKTSEYGATAKLNEAQLTLLQSLDYSSHFLMRTEFLKKNKESGEVEFDHYGPHYTVVPEKQAYYIPGKEALEEYIRVNNRENTANLDESKLQFSKLSFTVTKEGTITKVYLDRTSGYQKIDSAMISLLSSAPGKWEPAENTKGEKVDQDLAIFFGMPGC